MGVRDFFRLSGPAGPERLTAAAFTPDPAPIVSPWAQSPAGKVIFAELFPDAIVPVTRSEAMSVPSVKKARNLVAGNIARLPLKAYTGPDEVTTQPTFLYRTNAYQSSPQQRMLWTVDDLAFYGASLWWVTRGTNGQILTVGRVPFDDWDINADNEIEINGNVVSQDEVIYFAGPDEGVLANGSRTIRQAADIERTAAQRAGNPVPMIALLETDDSELTQEEVNQLTADWNAARLSKTGAVAFVPKGLTLQEVGQGGADFLVAARNQIAVDVANLFCLPASLLNGTTATASLTYVTQEGSRGELVDFGLSLWMDCITSRLSQDDVVPRGQRVAFDLSYLTQTPPSNSGVVSED